MNREDILRMSRSENAGARDERERAALGSASRFGMVVGGMLCALIILLDEPLFHDPALGMAAWIMFFAMQGSSNAALYRALCERKYLLCAIFELAFALAAVLHLVRAYG